MPSKVYLSRMIVPISNVLSSVVVADILKEPRSKLKYLAFALHDTNLSNFLRFLGFWETNGYSKHVRFASSIRLELLKKVNLCFSENEKENDFG